MNWVTKWFHRDRCQDEMVGGPPYGITPEALQGDFRDQSYSPLRPNADVAQWAMKHLSDNMKDDSRVRETLERVERQSGILDVQTSPYPEKPVDIVIPDTQRCTHSEIHTYHEVDGTSAVHICATCGKLIEESDDCEHPFITEYKHESESESVWICTHCGTLRPAPKECKHDNVDSDGDCYDCLEGVIDIRNCEAVFKSIRSGQIEFQAFMGMMEKYYGYHDPQPHPTIGAVSYQWSIADEISEIEDGTYPEPPIDQIGSLRLGIVDKDGNMTQEYVTGHTLIGHMDNFVPPALITTDGRILCSHRLPWAYIDEHGFCRRCHVPILPRDIYS